MAAHAVTTPSVLQRDISFPHHANNTDYTADNLKLKVIANFVMYIADWKATTCI